MTGWRFSEGSYGFRRLGIVGGENYTNFLKMGENLMRKLPWD